MHALVRERALSAHDVFKEQYSRTLRWSVLGALVVLTVAVLLMPEYRPTPYRLAQDPPPLIEIQMPETEVIPPPQTINRPRELEAADPGDPDVEPFPDLPILPVEPRNPGWIDPVEVPAFVVASTKPKLVQGAVADYPEIARLAGMQGTVVVKVQVDIDGSVARVQLLKGVHPLLDKPAMAAARKLRFTPGTQQHTPVACWVAVPFRFYLH